ncbi:MAG: YggS family pyridoxal phosphate-dependent enzyme [Culturomica sp.]|jgi:pyridoxal phosphate enzyme (YggS family)|nr:YggS family pyridoxal phosphate-dependent enzyme [Culturomica sp.]
MGVSENIKEILTELPNGVKLTAVSKTQSQEAIMQAYVAGQRIFGENRVKEIAEKHVALPKDIEWHFIGNLQTKNVKYIAPFIGLIHSVDSLELLERINKEAQKNNRVIKCLLEFHIAKEDSKSGLNEEEAEQLLDSEKYTRMKNISIVGVMGMATYTYDMDVVRHEFRKLKRIFENLKQKYFRGVEAFAEISMGMSNDYKFAVEEGSTMIRVGTAIFGERNKL